jgi:hypothetical protein
VKQTDLNSSFAPSRLIGSMENTSFLDKLLKDLTLSRKLKQLDLPAEKPPRKLSLKTLDNVKAIANFTKGKLVRFHS